MVSVDKMCVCVCVEKEEGGGERHDDDIYAIHTA